jgi:hypothetical protein
MKRILVHEEDGCSCFMWLSIFITSDVSFLLLLFYISTKEKREERFELVTSALLDVVHSHWIGPERILPLPVYFYPLSFILNLKCNIGLVSVV